MRSEAVRAYAAGIIDGEGSITVQRASVPAHGSKTMRVIPRLSVAMTHVETLQWLAAVWGGTVILRSYRELETHRRPVYVWEVRGHIMAAFLRDVHPFLRIKRKQADLALQLYGRHRVRLPFGHRISAEELSSRLALADAIQEANRAR